MLKIDIDGKMININYTWELTFVDTDLKTKHLTFNAREFKKLIDKIDELTYGKQNVFLVHRDNYGYDPFITKSANNLQHYIQNAPTWGCTGHYFIFCYESWEEAYETALLLQERFENCYKK